MADNPVSFDASHLDELAALKAEQRTLGELASRAAAHRDKVAEVYNRVVRDYEARIHGLEAQAERLRERVRAEFQTLDAAYTESLRLLEQARVEMQENEFRRDIGEFSAEEFDRRVAAIDQAIVSRQREIDRIGGLRQKYLDLMPAAELALPTRLAPEAAPPPVTGPTEPPAPVTETPEMPSFAAPSPEPERALEPAPAVEFALPELAPAAPPDKPVIAEPPAAPTFSAPAPEMAPPATFPTASVASEPVPTFPPPLPADVDLAPAAGVEIGDRVGDYLVTGATPAASFDADPAGAATLVNARDPLLKTSAFPVTSDTPSVPPVLSTFSGTASLMEQRADGSTYEHALGEHTCIGRWSGNEIVLTSHEVSRRHAEVVHDGSGYLLRDYKTPNRTYVNEEAVLEHRLVDGDRIAIGTHRFVFKMS